MRKGFTLLEALVALLVASATTAMLVRSVSALVGARRGTEALQTATIVAARSLEEMIARGATGLAVEDSSDRVAAPLGELERRRVVEPGPRENLWHVVVTVTPPRAGAAVVFRTLLRRPW
ncbi:MAG: prepilin-type N-terminal cleavage/methylation domain-containing protein, partial [Candidatus Binatia bacterium]